MLQRMFLITNVYGVIQSSGLIAKISKVLSSKKKWLTVIELSHISVLKQIITPPTQIV